MAGEFWNICSLKEVEKLIQETIYRFMACDPILLNLASDGSSEEKKLHEVCIAHKFANHLENVLQELSLIPERASIDIEYNRHGLEVKRWTDGKAFRPDILLHERSTDDQNYLVIEMKKDTNLGKDEQNLQDDISKIKKLCDPNGSYRYCFGFVIIATGKGIAIRFSHQKNS